MVSGCNKDDAPPHVPLAEVESIPKEGEEEEEEEEELKLSSEKQIAGFQFTGIENNGVTFDIPGEIDEEVI